MKFINQTGGAEHDAVESMEIDKNDDVVMTGYFKGVVDFDPGSGTQSFNSGSLGDNAFLVKYHADGSLKWAKHLLGSQSYGKGLSVVTDSLGNIYNSGFFDGKADFDPSSNSSYLNSTSEDSYFAKYDVNGSLLFVKQFASATTVNHAAHIKLDSNLNIYVAGTYIGATDFDPDTGSHILTGSAGVPRLFVAKYDQTGNFSWVHRYIAAGSWAGELNDVEIDDSGFLYTTGDYWGNFNMDPDASGFTLTTPSSLLGHWMYLGKHNLNGNFLWGKSYGSADGAITPLDMISYKNGLYIVGKIFGTVDVDPDTSVYEITSKGAYDAFLLKLDTAGNFQWVKQFGGQQGDFAQSIDIDDVGNIYISGFYYGKCDMDPGNNEFFLTISGGQDNNSFVTKLTNNGDFIWSVQLGNTGDKVGQLVRSNTEQKIYSVGVFEGTGNFHPGTETHEMTSNGLNDIYFLGMTDFGLAVDSKSEEDKYMIYPNPTNSSFTLELSSKNPHEYLVYNVHGKLLEKSVTKQGRTEIDLSSYPSGMYYLLIPELNINSRIIKN